MGLSSSPYESLHLGLSMSCFHFLAAWRLVFKSENSIRTRQWLYQFFCFCFFLTNLFIYLFLAVLALRCCVWAFSSCSKQGLLFVAVHGLLIVVASLVAEHRL